VVYYGPTPTSTSTAALPIDGVPVAPVSSVRYLGIYIDADLVMRTHVKKTASRCFAVLPSAPSDPSLCVNGHVPGIGGRSGCHTTRLRQRSLDRPSCLPVTASAVGLERRRAADLRLTTLRPCVRRADQPTLAAHWPYLRTRSSMVARHRT